MDTNIVVLLMHVCRPVGPMGRMGGCNVMMLMCEC